MSATVIHMPRAHKLACRLREEAREAQHVVENPAEYPPERVRRCIMFLGHRNTMQALEGGGA